MITTKRPIVVLLGMHRSGTSATMSVLNALGVNCGDQLIPAGRGNERGFWEHAGIVAAHERLLADLDRIWHGPSGSYPMPDGWLETRVAQRAKHKLIEIVETEVARLGTGVWGFKDPRTCRLLPLWQEVFRDARTEPHYILSVRNPAAVCASLTKHNGIGRRRAELLWLQHSLEPLYHCRDNLVLVTEYDRLIERTRSEVDRLASALGRLVTIGPTEKESAVARVSKEMRRHSLAGATAENAVVAKAYVALAAMAQDEQPRQSFADLVAMFPEVQRLFQPWQRDTGDSLFDWATRMIVRRKFR